MRPGSAELIEHYRRLAAGEQPLQCDPNDNIPMLPGEDQALKRIKEMEVSNLDRAIDLLTSGEAIEQIETRIAEHEAQLKKLKRLRKVLGGVTAAPKAKSKADENLEASIVDYVQRHGKSTASEIGEEVGVDYGLIGRCVAKSTKLKKINKLISLA